MDEQYKVPLDYPRSTTDEQLTGIITDLSELLVTTKNGFAAEKFSALLQLGLSELHHRRSTNDNNLTRQLNEENNRFFRKATILSVVVSLIATICSFVSIYFSYQGEKDDEVWQNSQRIHLVNMERTLDSVNFYLSRMAISNQKETSRLNKRIDSLNAALKRISLETSRVKKARQSK